MAGEKNWGLLGLVGTRVPKKKNEKEGDAAGANESNPTTDWTRETQGRTERCGGEGQKEHRQPDLLGKPPRYGSGKPQLTARAMGRVTLGPVPTAASQAQPSPVAPGPTRHEGSTARVLLSPGRPLIGRARTRRRVSKWDNI